MLSLFICYKLEFMKLYHYTSIDSLALILKNKTIRFTRLDLLDDLEENIKSSGVNIGSYAFASCWTDDKEESIPLWKMYTESGLGVRISLDSDMFFDYHNPEFVSLSGLEFKTKDTVLAVTKTPLEDFINPNILILPITPYEMESLFLKRIEYVDNVSDLTQNCVSIEHVTSNYSRIKINHTLVGKYKNRRWSFQKEIRFVILIFPGKQFNNINTFPTEFEQWLFNVWNNNIPNKITHYEMRLKDDIFNTMDITLSPCMPLSKQIIVNALVKEYAPQASISQSVLNASVRIK